MGTGRGPRGRKMWPRLVCEKSVTTKRDGTASNAFRARGKGLNLLESNPKKLAAALRQSGN